MSIPIIICSIYLSELIDCIVMIKSRNRFIDKFHNIKGAYLVEYTPL